MNILIPMAGLGSRFDGSRFKSSKPLIDIYGKPMIQRAIESFQHEDAKFIFVIRNTDDTQTVVQLLNTLCKNSIIKIIDDVTCGPACTSLLVEEYIDNDEELIIANCDQIMFWDFDKFLYYARHHSHEGVIVTYTTDTPKNSYAKIDKMGNVLQVKEKCVISNISLNGIHYWKKGKYFVTSSRQMIEARDTAPNGEFYVGPSYNYMIKNNQNVGIYHVANWQHNAVGVPADLEKFLRKYYESL